MEYVVAAYAVIWFVLLLYVLNVGLRTARIGRETELLARILDERAGAPTPSVAVADGASGVDAAAS